MHNVERLTPSQLISVIFRHFLPPRKISPIPKQVPINPQKKIRPISTPRQDLAPDTTSFSKSFIICYKNVATKNAGIYWRNDALVRSELI